MKTKIEKERNNYYFQNVNTNDKNFKYKIFRYFYSLFQLRKEYKSYLKIILIFIETIQIISYSFSSNHYNSWKSSTRSLKVISNILEGFRLVAYIKHIRYKIYSIISYLLIIIIFLLCLIILLNIIFIESESKLYKTLSIIIRPLIDLIVIVFYIPITEIILIPIKCVNGKVDGFSDGERCWQINHYLRFILVIIGSLLIFVWSFFMTFFSFYPFQNAMSTVRITSNNDIIILIMKLILILQNIFISNEYMSLFLLLLMSLVIFFSCTKESTYNNYKLEICINIRNLIIIWTNFVLLVCKLFQSVLADGFLYLLLFGYPIIIYLSFIISNEKDFDDINFYKNLNNINDYLMKAKFNIKLINSFIEKNQNIGNEDENILFRNITILIGNIKAHNLTCFNKECPLSKFLNNEGNFIVQKQCLLNYMNFFFNLALKKYPNNFDILILSIYFNFSKRFNLNSVRLNLSQLKKQKFSIKNKYIIYCLEQNIKTLNISGIDLNINNEQENNIQMDLTEIKYKKLKNLIDNSIKLYIEFWGIFSTNISTNINTTKLYSLGEKLNIYLKEINNLWNNELKNKKINNECESYVQLYSNFLLEVLWDVKKSKEVSKKLNEDKLNNYLKDTKQINEEKNLNLNNIEGLIDNEDFILFCEYDDKGKSKIIHSSTSFAQFLGYQKNYFIGKSIKKIFPNIVIEVYCQYFEKCIKLLHSEQNNQQNLSLKESDSNKKGIMILKNIMGYISPINSSINIVNDNDYSDTFIVKFRFENKESKSEYAYYILTNTEFVIENISSSAINLGLSLDLLKKYIVKLDNLIRINDEKLSNIEKLNEFEEEPKRITWIFPDIIYPKDNIQHKKEEEIEELIQKSKKKEYNMKIRQIKLNGKENIAFLFKLTETVSKFKNRKIKNEIYIPKSDKNLVMFYLYKLDYVRTYVVEQKSGLNNLKSKEDEDYFNKEGIYLNNFGILKTKKEKREIEISEEESSENTEKHKHSILTKDRVLELQVHNFIIIRNFIFSLPLYGEDVSLERFRPNKDKYSASKITESLIKIRLSEFCKRIDSSFHLEENLKRRKNVNFTRNSLALIEPAKSSINNNNLYTNKNYNEEPAAKLPPSVNGEESNKGLSSDASTALTNIFKDNIITYITFLLFVTFGGTIVLLFIEFFITYHHINLLKTKIEFVRDSHIILNDILYLKHFVTEGVLSFALKEKYAPAKDGLSTYINELSKNLAFFRQELSQTFDKFTSNKLCKEYKNFLSNRKIEIYSLTVNKPEKISILFNNAINRISSSVNNIISDPSLMIISNRDTYELMHNLLNEYFINWYSAVKILVEDARSTTKFKVPIIFIVLLYAIISLIIFFLFLKALAKFSFDREKPINLFLTIKKVVFENLKNSAENFSNQLLNKLFGNEDSERESQKDYQTNIKSNDINIAKFNAANENNSSINKAFDFMIIIIIISIFLLSNLLYFILKYFKFRNMMNNIDQFIFLYNRNSIAHADIAITVEILKSFLYNKSIIIYNEEYPIDVFIQSFLTPTERFEEAIILTSKTSTFLNGNYLDKYKEYYLRNYYDLLEKDIALKFSNNLSILFNYGIKPIETIVHEIIRYNTIRYCISSEINKNDDKISEILTDSGFDIIKLNLMLESIVYKWYNGINNLMICYFFEYQKNSKTKFMIGFTSLIIIIILYYCFIWRNYEEKLNNLLKASVDLINLIPQEIKNIIIEKLNE